MFTTFDSHLPAVAETGLAGAPYMTRGPIQADVALAGRKAP